MAAGPRRTRRHCAMPAGPQVGSSPLLDRLVRTAPFGIVLGVTGAPVGALIGAPVGILVSAMLGFRYQAGFGGDPSLRSVVAELKLGLRLIGARPRSRFTGGVACRSGSRAIRGGCSRCGSDFGCR